MQLKMSHTEHAHIVIEGKTLCGLDVMWFWPEMTGVSLSGATCKRCKRSHAILQAESKQ